MLICIKSGTNNPIQSAVISGNEIYGLTRLGIYIDSWESLIDKIEVYDNTVCEYWFGVEGIGDSHPVDYISFDSNIVRNNDEECIRISVPSAAPQTI